MNSRRSIVVKRVAAAALFGLVLVQVIPSLADVVTEAINGPQVDESVAQSTPETTLIAEPSQSPSAAIPTSSTAPAPVPTAVIEYPGIETATPAPTYAPSQLLRIRIPAKFPVDPRATSLHISPIAISGGETLLVCMSVDNAILQLTGSNPDLLIEGNGSKSLRISGDGAAVNELLNAGRGLRLVASARINGAVVTTRAASLTAPSVEREFCSGAKNTLVSVISAMGLGMNTVKVPVPIK